MNCIAWCLAAYAILGAFIATQFVKTKRHLFEKFNRLLDSDQKTAYQRITQMRASIFTKGILVGLLISGLVATTFYHKTQIGVGKLVCLVISVTLITCYLFYQIHPKSDYMLRYLDSREQLIAWWDIYRTFRTYNYLGIAIGILAYITIGCSMAF